MKGKQKILVVDDEQIINEAIEKIASTDGYVVEVATSGEEAFDILENKNIGLMLCDIMMPEMDGFQLLKEKNDRGIKTPIIMISGYSTVENIVKALYEGAIDFIPKPFTYMELISSIKRGFKYIEIQNDAANGEDGQIAYVPCPPKYKKLGDLSWIDVHNEGLVTVGLTDIFLKTLASIGSIDLLSINEEIIQANPAGSVTCFDEMTHSIIAPIGGKIIERNDRILNNPLIIEKDPYFEGWVYNIIPTNYEYDSGKLINCSSERI